MSAPGLVRFAAIGECMIELRHLDDTHIELAFGGDTFNTSAYLSRLGRKSGVKVDYATALGDDPYSEAMRATIRREGVGLDLIATLPGRLPGLYAIRTDARGERSFYYWRREAAARSMLDGEAGDRLAAALPHYNWIYLSGITLSILEEKARQRLLAILDGARSYGAKIAFDSNFRPRGWPDRDVARRAFEAILRRTHLALPTFGDEQTLFGNSDPTSTALRLHTLGVDEVVVKNGEAPVLVSTTGNASAVAAREVPKVVDTTAAGDAFNAGYIAARIAGLPSVEAAQRGHRLSAAVIGHRGAIIPEDAMPRD